MFHQWLPALFGFLGGILPGGIHLAWTVTRGNHTDAGNIDLTLRRKP